ncbi:hypothetical protein NMY22_g16485 [Coprinellus aureogranulatus]|nr:hypothetical protein NMY22_g16485 [Coprinellus aureogranulatus]
MMAQPLRVVCGTREVHGMHCASKASSFPFLPLHHRPRHSQIRVMFNNAQYFRVGEASQVNTGNYYNWGSSNVHVHDSGHYSQTIGITAHNAYFNNGEGRMTMKDLQQNIVEDALHNSDQRCDAPACYPETRKAVQADIYSWITDGDDDDEPKKIMWLSGPAGSGKTAIAGSIAETCEERGLLAGSFFFSCFRGAVETSSKRGVIPTLAYSFLQHESLQFLRVSIFSSIDRDPSIFRRRLREQCKTLLLRPFHLASSASDRRSIPQVIIVDGVDEIKATSRKPELTQRQADEADQLEVLSVLLQSAQDPHFPFRILIVSRPERVIRNFFTTQGNHITRQLHLDKEYNADSDIELFLQAKFSDIRRRYGLPSSWANDGVIKKLVDNASGQFVYADTVIRFLESGQLKDGPQVRLDCVLGLNAHRDVLKPFASLDALYTHILQQSPDPALAAEWIRNIAPESEPAFFIRHCLEEEVGQAYHLLENLSSLLYIPPDDDLEGEYELYHKSLLDFLGDPARSVTFPPLHKFKVAGVRCYDIRITCILQKKIPVTPLPESKLKIFHAGCIEGIRDLFDNSTDAYESIWQDDAAIRKCDVFWWMNTAISLFLEEDVASPDVPPLARHMFQSLHWDSSLYDGNLSCFREDTKYRCTSLCTHWRAGIYNAFARRGASLPDARFLLQERMWVEASTVAAHQGVSLSSPLRPDLPSFMFELNSHSQPSTASSSDYALLLRQVDEIYARLPDRWEEEYIKERKMKRGYQRNVLEALINQIEHEIQSSNCNLVDDSSHSGSFHPLFDNLVDPSDPSFNPALDALFKSIFP